MPPTARYSHLGAIAQSRCLTRVSHEISNLLWRLDLDDVDSIGVRINRHNHCHVLVLLTLESVGIVDFVLLAVGIVLEGLAVMAHGTRHVFAIGGFGGVILTLASLCRLTALTGWLRLILGLGEC